MSINLTDHMLRIFM